MRGALNLKDILFENTKMAAYFLWEYTQHSSSLDLWSCSEDMAYYMETKGYFTVKDLQAYLRNDTQDIRYIYFIRNVAFRIYIYTRNTDAFQNWLTAERLVRNEEWCDAIVKMAEIYNKYKENFNILSGVRSEQVKQYYGNL